MMKFKIVVNENFQTIETVVETEDVNVVCQTIKDLRHAILDATADVEDKKKTKNNTKTEKPKTTETKQRMATRPQIDYLKGLGVVVPDDITFEEARQMLNELGR